MSLMGYTNKRVIVSGCFSGMGEATARLLVGLGAESTASTTRDRRLVFLNSDVASYVNGVVLPVDGGFMGGIATGQIDLRAMMKSAS